jgi:hypothetical protein
MEIHYDATHSKFQAWVDGVKYLDASVGGMSPISSFLFPSNQNNPHNGGCAYYDIDDVAISNTGYIGPIGFPPSPPKNLRIVGSP